MHNYINVYTTKLGLNVNLVNATMHEKPFVEVYIESVSTEKNMFRTNTWFSIMKAIITYLKNEVKELTIIIL